MGERGRKVFEGSGHGEAQESRCSGLNGLVRELLVPR